jgi:hypothetical protein
MGTAMLAAVALASGTNGAGKALPRIGVRAGHFVEIRSGHAFEPRGVNYIKCRLLHKDGQTVPWHDTFNPQSYSADEAERAFSDLASHGLTVVRVFLDQEAGPGIADARHQGLSRPYLDNLADFLRRARSHRVRVILCCCWLPDTEEYRKLASGSIPNVESENVAYLLPSYVRAKAKYVAEVAAEIKIRDPGLLSTVFAYEMENESFYVANAAPFSLTKGSVVFEGKTYDLASEEEQQRLADDGVVAAANACVEAVRRVDPQAMVSVSAFTFHAVGRTGPGRLREDHTPDVRFPVRPLAVARSKASYVDVHFYPTEATSTDRDFASIELDALKAACARAGKPMLVGEVGAFKFAYKTLPEAVTAMRREIRRLLDAGFAGFLFWTYDNLEQADVLWHTKSGDGQMLDALCAIRR